MATDFIGSLREDFRPLARAIEAACDAEAEKHGLSARIIQGYRSWAEQQAKYRQGRYGDTRPRVTNAPPGYSWHNYGLAIDIGLFDVYGNYYGNHALYELMDEAVKAWKIPGLVVGTSFNDDPHYQFSGTYGAAVPERIAQQYATRPFDLPITVPTAPPIPSPLPPMLDDEPFIPNEEQQEAFDLMMNLGIFTDRTPRNAPMTTEMFSVMMKRAADKGLFNPPTA